MVSKLEASRLEKSCSDNVIKRYFLARRWCHNSREFKGIENWDHEISFPRPWIWFSISYAKPTSVINGIKGLDLLPLCSCLITFFFSEIIDGKILGRNLNETEENSRLAYFCINSVMSLIGKTSVRHLTGAPPQSFQVPPLISSVGKIMIFKTFFPLLPSIFEADPGLSRL